MCDWGLPRRLYGRGAALLRYSQSSPWDEASVLVGLGVLLLPKKAPAGSFPGASRGPGGIPTRISIKTSRSILLVIIEKA